MGLKMHPRYEIVAKAESEIASRVLDLLREQAGGDYTWERAVIAVLAVETLCLGRSGGAEIEPETLGALNNDFARDVWAVVEMAVEEHDLTWGEVSRIVHHIPVSWLNYIVRIERHGDDPDARADLA